MKTKMNTAYRAAAALLIVSFVLLAGAMIIQGVFGDEDIFAAVEIACSGGSALTAFAGIILACLSKSKKTRNAEEQEEPENGE